MYYFLEEIKKRKMYLLIFYIIGYLFPIIMDGLSNIYYLCPIKIIAMFFSFALGNAFYDAKMKRTTVPEALLISAKYVIPGMIVVGVFILLQQYLYNNYGIDIGPIIGVSPQ